MVKFRPSKNSSHRALRSRIRSQVAADMRPVTERANEVLLANLRRAMPHANLPRSTVVQALPEDVWWPLYDRTAFAIDDASRKAGLPPYQRGDDACAAVAALMRLGAAGALA